MEKGRQITEEKRCIMDYVNYHSSDFQINIYPIVVYMKDAGRPEVKRGDLKCSDYVCKSHLKEYCYAGYRKPEFKEHGFDEIINLKTGIAYSSVEEALRNLETKTDKIKKLFSGLAKQIFARTSSKPKLPQ